jgi:bacillithiol biosynthesis cysteine-adding enzyme BshC
VDCRSSPIPYAHTRKFSPFITDYLSHKKDLEPFHAHPVSLEGVKAAMASRDAFPTDRKVLVSVLERQYLNRAHPAQLASIRALEKDNSYTITTAHQPNIFTGYLYLVYKILHVIRIAEDLTQKFQGSIFVPVFYIGSEDNDLEELGQLQVAGNKLVWETKQTGAVGRMKVDDPLLALLDRIEAQLGVEPHGAELVAQLRQAYVAGADLATSTAKLIDSWMGRYGLLVLQPDEADLKRSMIPVFREELLRQASFPVVTATTARIGEHYKTQIHPREINLFYLTEGSRERITRQEDGRFHVEHTGQYFTEQEILAILEEYPERFSPNVVLRPVYQSTILPDVVFVGGGAELAYWMQLRDLFSLTGRPFPVLVLRNSFMLLNKKQEDRLERLGFTPEAFFADTMTLTDVWVNRHGNLSVHIPDEIKISNDLYDQLIVKAELVDKTLVTHISSLQKKAEKGLHGLEKKLVRAEKRKYTDQIRQLEQLHEELFPGGGLQERVDNILPYYAKYGAGIIPMLHAHSGTLEQEFRVITGLE